MGSGTGVAKQAADLVLGDDSFATLMYGLAEGRRIVDNVQKGLIFLISTHVAFLGFILIATVYGFGQPLIPLQILWMELFIDLSTSVAFELEKAEPDLMRRRPRPGDPLLTDDILRRIVLAGSYSAIAALVVMVEHPGDFEHTRWLAYTSLVCAQAVRANANRSIREPIHRLPVNWFLLVAGFAVVAIQAAIPYVPSPCLGLSRDTTGYWRTGSSSSSSRSYRHWSQRWCERSPGGRGSREIPAILARMSLSIDHVTKRFGATLALDRLTFEVATGEVFGFLGANGAGKTTTMRICLGIVRADSGEIRWSGTPTAELPRRTWGYLPEERGLYARMTVLDQLVYFASLYGEPPDRRGGPRWRG